MAGTSLGAGAWRHSVEFEAAPWRVLGAAMVGLGALLPHVAHSPVLPCPLRSITGVPCPMCGMTTSVKALCNGHVMSAFAANPFGLVAVLAALILLARPGMRSVRVSLPLLAAAGAASWAWQLHRFGYL